MDKMHPLFGNTWDIESTAASSNPEECSIINQVLAHLNPDLDALTTYNLVRKFIAFKSNVRPGKTTVGLIATTMERFLNWAFFVRRLSPLKMQSEDIIQFYEFYLAPPISYLRTERLCKRFVGSGASRSVNPNWRPFYIPPKSDHNVASILRRFYKYAAQITPIDMTLPRGRLRANSACPEDLLQDRIQVDKYFDTLIENTDPPIRSRSNRASRKKQVFVFATCYLLDIPFARLAKCTRFFSMSSFSKSGNAWNLNLQNDDEWIFRELPERYIMILRNYRSSVGLDGMPAPHEIEPIFVSRRAVEHVWGSLPVFAFMNATIGKYLRRLISYAEKDGPPGKSILDEPKSTAHARRTKKSLRVAVEIFDRRKRLETPRRSSCHPPSLFTYCKDNSRLIGFVDQKSLQTKIGKCLIRVDHDDVSTINMFALYANSERGKKNRYKVSAFEKLVLWCLLIKGIFVAHLTDRDAIEFFCFCSTPPPHWCSNTPKSTGAGSGRSSSEWRPFKILKNEKSMNLRAIRIIEWCSAVAQDLIDMAALGHNPFSELSNRLGSSKRH